MRAGRSGLRSELKRTHHGRTAAEAHNCARLLIYVVRNNIVLHSFGLLPEICRCEFELSSIVSVVVRKTDTLGGSEFAGTNIVHK